MIRLITLLAFGLSISGLCLNAQTTPAFNAPARTFRIFSVVGSFPNLKLDLTAKQSITLHINRELSGSYPCPAGASFILYRELPVPADAPAGAKPVKEIVLEAPLPADQAHVIIVVAPLNDKKLAAKVLGDDPKKHAGGTLRMINFSTFPAAVSLNDENHPLDIGTSTIVSYDAGSTLIRMAVQKNGHWALAFNKERIARPGIRAYGFVFNYAPDPELDGGGPPPPALFRFFTEPVIEQKIASR